MKKLITIIACFILTTNAFTQTITHDTICSTGNYTWNGNTYSTAGTYTSGIDTLVLTVFSCGGSYNVGDSVFYCGNDSLLLEWRDFHRSTPFSCTDSFNVFVYLNGDSFYNPQWTLNGSSIGSGQFVDDGGRYIGLIPTVSYSIPGDVYTFHINTLAGCVDSLSFVLANCGFATYDSTCLGSDYTWNGQSYDSVGTYTYGLDTLVLTGYSCSNPADVWPGDANHDGIADNYDLLHIGIGYDNNGPVRQDQSIVWSAHACNDWSLQFTNGTNLKHADCNGNGVINADDTLAVVQNFDLTHNKNNEREDDRSGAPYLNVAFNNDSFVNGDTLIASIQLGSADVLANNVYGVAFTYNFDASVLDTSNIEFFYTNSWLDSDTNKLSIAKNFYNLGQIKTAIARTDHTNRSGNGEIAQFRAIITTDNINGISWHNTSHFITLSRAVDSVGYLIALNEGIDSAVVLKSSLGISDVKEISFTLSPNPANSTITIKGTENIEGIVIVNVLGEKVFTENNTSTSSATTTKNIDISNLPNGIYIAQISTHKGIGEKRFIVAR